MVQIRPDEIYTHTRASRFVATLLILIFFELLTDLEPKVFQEYETPRAYPTINFGRYCSASARWTD